jgi:hypothetical protein
MKETFPDIYWGEKYKMTGEERKLFFERQWRVDLAWAMGCGLIAAGECGKIKENEEIL